MFLCCLGIGIKGLTDSGIQELRLFESEGGPLIQVEVNLEEAPLFMFKRRDRREESTEARNTVLTRDGDRLEQYWKITAHRDFGLPGPQDQDVFVAVMTVVSRRGGIPPDGRVSFTLYKLVDVKRKESLSWSVELEGLRLLLSMPETYKYPSAIKRQLEPAHRELVEKGFLSRADFEERGRGPTKTNVVRYRVSQRFVRERSRPLPELSDGERFATEALVAQGVWPQAARELVVKHGAGHCLHYVEALPYQEGVKNPAGWLRTHIENAWPVRVPEEPPTLPAAEANETVIEVPDLASEGENPIRPGRLGPDPSLSDPAKPEPAQAAAAHRRAASEEVEMRRASGEFDGAIEAFETLPYEEYR